MLCHQRSEMRIERVVFADEFHQKARRRIQDQVEADDGAGAVGAAKRR